jgi:hypothetical protein
LPILLPSSFSIHCSLSLVSVCYFIFIVRCLCLYRVY